MKLKTITAIERDGFNVRTLTIVLNIIGESINIKEAVRNACTKYASTEEGRKVFAYNCNNFNWADFEANVPNDICRQFGFEKVSCEFSDEEVIWDEQLVNENALPLSDEEWEQLKTELFMCGLGDIEEFLGYEINDDYDKDVIDNILDEVAMQMPDEELRNFYNQYCG